MKNYFTKISLFILFSAFVIACNTTKRVAVNKQLLYKTDIVVDNKLSTSEEVYNQLYQKPNSAILGYRLRLNLYNLAKQNSDSLYEEWLIRNPKTDKFLTGLLSKKQVERLGQSFLVSGLSKFLIKNGESPVLLDSNSTKKSIKRLNAYYFNKGYFDVKTKAKSDSLGNKKAGLNYTIALGKPYVLDSVKTIISTPALDSLYQLKKNNSFLKSNNQYNTENFSNERNRITADFRNNGAFDFQQNYITYNLDTINNNKKANVKLFIKNLSYRDNDSVKTRPFKLYKISKVAIFADHSPNSKTVNINDSISYNNFNIYTEKKLKYKPKAITDAVFITKGSYYSDENAVLTTKYLGNLKVFNYPSIQYKVDPKNENALIATIYLTSRKKYTFNPSIDFTHSNIQDFGISGNTALVIRNVFNRAETFSLGLRGNLGASKDLANPYNRFFNISEIGIDSKLSFPRILFPVKTERIIPKNMFPSTIISMGFASQTNIGLNKQNFTSTFSYNWIPKKNTSMRFDLLNIQFVKNLNTGNYFNIYQSSYNTLNAIASNYASFGSQVPLAIEGGTDAFMNDVLNTNTALYSAQDVKTVRSVEERKQRLSENNLIFASNISYSKTTQKDIYDNSFHAFKTKIESAGNLLSIIASMSKKLNTQNGANTFFGVQYSQYIKGEFEFVKHWSLSKKRVFAIRTFSGLAIPYKNATTIPFSRSYFAGGSNDIRAWQPYSLGPGSSGGIYDFNEANLKLTFNSEYRFNIFGKFNGVLFADAGNIWNVFEPEIEKSYKFKGLNSLNEVALGTGLGMRYDQGLFVIRFDLGFKTYNPSEFIEQKWFREVNLSKAVLNLGINYPF